MTTIAGRVEKQFLNLYSETLGVIIRSAIAEHESQSSAEVERLKKELEDLRKIFASATNAISELQMQIAQLDADNAALIRSNRSLNDSLQMTRHQQSMRHPMRHPDETAVQLSKDDCLDWVEGLNAKRHMWRHVPRAMQLRIIRHVLNEINPAARSIAQSEFNGARPEWMPTATTLCATLHMQWSAINDVNAMLPVGAQ